MTLSTIFWIPLLISLVTSSVPIDTPYVQKQKETVILVHGLARSSNAMWLLQYRLEKTGYRTCSVNYPSRTASLETLTDILGQEISRCMAGSLKTTKPHFVTHSMGGPLLRAFLAENPTFQPGRIVMLSPPNKGSPLMDRIRDLPFSELLLGEAALGLATEETSWINHLPPVRGSIGILAGSFTFNPIAATLLKGPDDGLVPVASMKLEGVSDFKTVFATHFTIRLSKPVFDNIHHFLKTGEFIS